MSKIERIHTRIASLPLPIALGTEGAWLATHVDNVVTTIQTDDGLTGSGYVWLPSPRGGSGEPTPTGTIRVVAQAVRALEPFVVGQDLFSYERVWAAVQRHLVQAGHGVMTLAHSAIDMAIWDAMCRAMGQPLYKVLGNARSPVPFYTNELLMHCTAEPDEFAELAVGLVKAGHRALKMPLSINPGEHEQVDIARIKAVREAVGPDVRMMVDVGGRIPVEKVIRLGRQLEEVGLTWLEDPVPLDQIGDLVHVRRSVRIPIATGETGYGLKVFNQLFQVGALDILLFEPMRVGGITGSIKLAAMAGAYDIPVAPHTYPDLAVHLMAGLPNGLIGEYLPWWEGLFARPVEIVGGYATPRDEPGIGFNFAPELVEVGAAR